MNNETAQKKKKKKKKKNIKFIKNVNFKLFPINEKGEFFRS